MLVLSRRINERIVIPGVDTSIQVVAVKPGVVRLGIDAPDRVTVFREEVWQRDGKGRPHGELLAAAEAAPELRRLNHLVRNQVNTAGLGLDLLRRQLQAGMMEQAEHTLQTLESEMTLLREQVQKGATVEAVPPPAPARPRKALLAEDNQNERELFAALLRMAGLEVETAGDGDDVLDYLDHQGRPDVLLLDMRLPRRDGPSTVQMIRKTPAYADLPIFAVSGHNPDFFGLDEQSLPVDRWFLKPINPDTMLRALTHDLRPRA